MAETETPSILTATFWRAAIERAAKTAAQAAILAIVGSAAITAEPQVNALTVDWATVAGFAAGGAVLSVLFSLASVKFGPAGSPSLVVDAAAGPPLSDGDPDAGE